MRAESQAEWEIRAYQRSLAAGEVVFEPGEAGHHFYVIRSGEVELQSADPSVQEPLALLGAGDFFGEYAAMLGEQRELRAVAKQATRVLAVDRESLESICRESPEIALRIARGLADRLGAAFGPRSQAGA
jgi:CRP-like cAMP-binding protein